MIPLAVKRLLRFLVVLVLTVAAFFYLFIVPALVATGAADSWGAFAFGAFLYAQLWLLVVDYLYRSMAGLYGFKRTELLPFARLLRPIARRSIEDSLSLVFVLAFLSWAVSVYGFALAYAFTNTLDSAAFSPAGLSLFDFFYFSFMTSTAGSDGSAAPLTVGARVLVMLQVALGFVYAAFVVTVLVNEAANRGKEPNQPLHRTPTDGDAPASGAGGRRR